MQNRPAKAAFDAARARGMKGKMLTPYRVAMSKEAEILHAHARYHLCVANMEKIQQAVEKMKEQGMKPPFFMRVNQGGIARDIEVKQMVDNLMQQGMRELETVRKLKGI